METISCYNRTYYSVNYTFFYIIITKEKRIIMLIVSPLVKMHICKRAKEHNIKYINGMEDVLQKFIQMPQMNGYNLAFLYMQSDGRRVLQASAAIPKTITSSAEWAAVLVLKNDDIVNNAYQITLGHELGHKNGDFPVWKNKKENRKFIYWTTEVHHDFYAAQLVAESSRKRLLDALIFKKNFKEKDISSLTHPSWEKRVFYAENFDFGFDLIAKIAEDTQCKDHNSIKNVNDFYSNIILTD